MSGYEVTVHDFNCLQFNFIYLSYDSGSEMHLIQTCKSIILVMKKCGQQYEKLCVSDLNSQRNKWKRDVS